MNSHSWRNVPQSITRPNFILTTGGFTIDKPGTRCKEQAITLEDCKIHVNCKNIGIHVAAAAENKPERFRPTELPHYMPHSTTSRNAGLSMDKDKIIPAISVFVHTNDEATIGPVLTRVMVAANYSFDDRNREEYQTKMHVLWSHFGEDSLGHMMDAVRCYILDSPEVWKDLFLLDRITAKFNAIVTKAVVEGSNHYFITKPHLLPPERFADVDKITVFKDRMADAANGFLMASNPADIQDKILIFVSAGDSSQHRTTRLFENFQPFKYQSDVKRSDQILLSRTLVKSTCPLRNFQHFVNQQVLVRCMSGSAENLYTRDDLLGILGIRFKTSILARPFILEADEDAVILRYPQDAQCDGSLYEVDPKLLTNNGASCSSSEGRYEILLEGISCSSEDLCNRALVHFNLLKYENIREKIANAGNNLDELKDLLKELSEGRIEEESPYRRKEDGIILILQRGAELQLQISNEDAKKHNDLGLRLLRIGKNCHVCLTHINHPEKAFMSDREDVRKLLKPKHIAAMKETKNLKAFRLKEVNVKWDGDYFSGGIFELEKQATKGIVRVGDLLCIRQEVLQKDNEIQYVWVCHAIVSDIDEGCVKFSVCTLSQTRIDVTTKEGFCVEVIKIPAVDESAYTDERDLD